MNSGKIVPQKLQQRTKSLEKITVIELLNIVFMKEYDCE